VIINGFNTADKPENMEKHAMIPLYVKKKDLFGRFD